MLVITCSPKIIIMPIPDFQTVMRSLLESHGDGKEHVNRDLINSLADQFNLSEEELREMYQAAVLDFRQ